jgi:hypothetical protein
MMAQPFPNPAPDLFDTDILALNRHHERSDYLSVFFIGDANDGYLLDSVVREETVFDLEGVDVFAAADDEVFDAAGDGYIAFRVHGGFVAGLGVRL